MDNNDSLWRIFKQALKHFWDSKTNFWMWWASLLGFAAFIVVMVLYGEVLLVELLTYLGFNGGGAVVRAIGVDGIPKIVASNKDPNSVAANPPPAVTEVQPSTVQVIPPEQVTNLPQNYGERPPL